MAARRGHHVGFRKLKKQLAAKGARNPGGLARYIGQRKYGKAGFAAKTTAGRRAATRRKRK